MCPVGHSPVAETAPTQDAVLASVFPGQCLAPWPRLETAPFHIEPEIWAWVRIPRLSGTLPQDEDQAVFSSLRFQSFLDRSDTMITFTSPEERKGAPGRVCGREGTVPGLWGQSLWVPSPGGSARGAATFLRVGLPGNPASRPSRCFRRRRPRPQVFAQLLRQAHVLFSGLLPAPSSLIKPF